MDDPTEAFSAELGALAVDLVRRAGALVAEGRDQAGLDVDTKSTPTDVVTEMDRRSERFLSEQIRARRPSDAILGEEGARQEGRSGVRWLIDPIDGTVNYLYGLPMYAVSVAAEYDGAMVAGAVHNPSLGETYHAVRGRGAWLGNRRLAGGTATRLDQALIGTGFAYDAARRARQGQVVAALLPRVRDVRRNGAASLDLCHAAAGRLDGFYEGGLSPWDYGAGCLIAAEAGLVVQGLHGRPVGPQFVLAAAAAIAGELTELLEGLGADAA